MVREECRQGKEDKLRRGGRTRRVGEKIREEGSRD